MDPGIHPDFLERLVGGREQGRGHGELRGTLWPRHSKRAVIFRELHSCPSCGDCGFLIPAQLVLVTWDVCSFICLGSGLSCIDQPSRKHPTPPHWLL